MDDLTNKTPSDTEVYDAVILGDAVDGFCYTVSWYLLRYLICGGGTLKRTLHNSSSSAKVAAAILRQ